MSVNFTTVMPQSVTVTRDKAVVRTVSPYTFAHQAYANPGRRWRASYVFPPLNSTNANSVLTFLEAMGGGTETTQVNISNYVPHENVSNVTMTVDSSSYTFTRNRMGHYEIRFDLVESTL